MTLCWVQMICSVGGFKLLVRLYKLEFYDLGFAKSGRASCKIARAGEKWSYGSSKSLEAGVCQLHG
jgi:hypothetical protein